MAIDPRYISAAVRVCTGGNFSALINSLRLQDACKMLREVKSARLSVEEIAMLCGFNSRQAFYAAFHRTYDCTPAEFRKGGN